MAEEYLSLNQFEKRYKLGHEAVLKMIENGEVDYIKTGTRYRIKVGDSNTVSRELYENEKAKRIKAETTLDLLKKVLMREEK